ncbi:MAG: RsmE family RNA methyltransferase [Planctomycetota bacterium]
MHRFLIEPDLWPAGDDPLKIEGDEARHAIRVKRVRTPEAVEVLDGAGRRGVGVVAEIAESRRACVVAFDEVRTEAPIEPRLEIWSAAPKGDRIEVMVDHLSQIGATAWVPVVSELTARELTAKRAERLERVARESLKQCGRAWTLEIGGPRSVQESWDTSVATVLVADASGGPMPAPDANRPVRFVVGPEGGWTADELVAARAAGASVVSLGPHVLRIGTAAVVGAGLIRAV